MTRAQAQAQAKARRALATELAALSREIGAFVAAFPPPPSPDPVPVPVVEPPENPLLAFNEEAPPWRRPPLWKRLR